MDLWCYWVDVLAMDMSCYQFVMLWMCCVIDLMRCCFDVFLICCVIDLSLLICEIMFRHFVTKFPLVMHSYYLYTIYTSIYLFLAHINHCIGIGSHPFWMTRQCGPKNLETWQVNKWCVKFEIPNSSRNLFTLPIYIPIFGGVWYWFVQPNFCWRDGSQYGVVRWWNTFDDESVCVCETIAGNAATTCYHQNVKSSAQGWWFHWHVFSPITWGCLIGLQGKMGQRSPPSSWGRCFAMPDFSVTPGWGGQLDAINGLGHTVRGRGVMGFTSSTFLSRREDEAATVRGGHHPW